VTRAEAYRRWRQAALIAALAGGIASVTGAALDPHAFFPAWLAAFSYWLSLPLGALALLLIRNLTGGEWQAVARAPLTAAAATMPLFILAFLPILVGLHDLYPWTEAHADALANHWYLNLEFFGIRAALYFLVWNFFAFWQLRGAAASARSQLLSALGLILIAISVTWAAIDWIMSIEPDWFSSIFGMMIGSGEFVLALAFALAVIVTDRNAGLAEDAFGRHLANLATILLAVDIFWAYTSFSQWLIIWEENLTSEIPWYIERLRPLWRSIVLAVVFLNLAVPLFALVWTPAKRRPALVRNVCLLLLIGSALQEWWLILPHFHSDTGLIWLAPVTMIALGGAWLWLFLWRLEHGHWLAAPSGVMLTKAKS
jgi:hypothetical protein